MMGVKSGLINNRRSEIYLVANLVQNQCPGSRFDVVGASFKKFKLRMNVLSNLVLLFKNLNMAIDKE